MNQFGISTCQYINTIIIAYIYLLAIIYLPCQFFYCIQLCMQRIFAKIERLMAFPINYTGKWHLLTPLSQLFCKCAYFHHCYCYIFFSLIKIIICYLDICFSQEIDHFKKEKNEIFALFCCII